MAVTLISRDHCSHSAPGPDPPSQGMVVSRNQPDQSVMFAPVTQALVFTCAQIQKNGSWGDRQLYLTSRELGFSYVDGDALLDFIPLSEIDTVSDSPDGGGIEQFYEGSFKGSVCFTVVTQKDGVYHGKSFEFRCNTGMSSLHFACVQIFSTAYAGSDSNVRLQSCHRTRAGRLDRRHQIGNQDGSLGWRLVAVSPHVPDSFAEVDRHNHVSIPCHHGHHLQLSV